MPAETPQPTARHLELARRALHSGPEVSEGDGLVERVAQLLADQDAHRAPLASVGAAYRRGMRTIVGQAEKYLTRHPYGSPAGVVGWIKAYEQATSDPGDPRTLDAFRAWLTSDDDTDRAVALAQFVDPDAALIALDAYEGTLDRD